MGGVQGEEERGKLTDVDDDVLATEETALTEGLVDHVVGHDGGTVCKLIAVQSFDGMGHDHNAGCSQDARPDQVALVSTVTLKKGVKKKKVRKGGVDWCATNARS